MKDALVNKMALEKVAQRARGGAKGMLMLILIGSALLKAFGGHDESFLIGPVVFYFAIAYEVVAAALLISGKAYSLFGAYMSVALGVGGSILSIADGRRCGCLGVWVHMSPMWHWVMSMGVGALAVLVLLGSDVQSRIRR